MGNESGLAKKSCVPCMGGVPPLDEGTRNMFLLELNGWAVVDGHHLAREFPFPDFVTALAFVNRAGEIAEAEGHHPELTVTWGSVKIRIWTHKIDGLTESDFILAAKFDELEAA